MTDYVHIHAQLNVYRTVVYYAKSIDIKKNTKVSRVCIISWFDMSSVDVSLSCHFQIDQISLNHPHLI